MSTSVWKRVSPSHIEPVGQSTLGVIAVIDPVLPMTTPDHIGPEEPTDSGAAPEPTDHPTAQLKMFVLPVLPVTPARMSTPVRVIWNRACTYRPTRRPE